MEGCNARKEQSVVVCVAGNSANCSDTSSSRVLLTKIAMQRVVHLDVQVKVVPTGMTLPAQSMAVTLLVQSFAMSLPLEQLRCPVI